MKRYIKKFESFESTSIGWHTTNKKNLEKILAEGLIPGQKSYMTIAGEWADKVYGIRPIYISLEPWKTKTQDLTGENHVTLELNLEGLDLVADLPSLYDRGAYYDYDWGGIYFDNTPEELEEFKDEETEIILFDFLIDPYHPACEEAMKLTGSCACLNPIDSSRVIKILE
jgi:hypothetical protein